jgi:cytoskeletal protein CcmA (bactofilin family)
VIWGKKKDIESEKSEIQDSGAKPTFATKPTGIAGEALALKTGHSETTSIVAPVLEKAPTRALENVRSVLSEGTVINGRLTFDTPVKIDGKLSGEVFSSDVLVVGKTGKIDAKVDVQTLIIYGHVSGEVRARDTIEVAEGGALTANISTKKLIIKDALFSGACKMS